MRWLIALYAIAVSSWVFFLGHKIGRLESSSDRARLAAENAYCSEKVYEEMQAALSAEDARLRCDARLREALDHFARSLP